MVSAAAVLRPCMDEGFGFVEVQPKREVMEVFHPDRRRDALLPEWSVRKGSFVLDDEDEGWHARRPAIPRDMSSNGSLVLLGDKVQAVGPLLEPWGELLPVEVEDEPGVLFHCLHVVDAVDVEASMPLYSPTSPERILSFERYAFRAGVVPDGCAFILPKGQPSLEFFTPGLVRGMREATDTTGLRFAEIWTEAEGALRPRRYV